MVRLERGWSVWAAAVAWCIAIPSVGCSQALRHQFDPRKAHDYGTPRGLKPRSDDALYETRAVLLLPSNTTLFRGPPRTGISQNDDDRVSETYVGPARIFLRPGSRRYTIGVRSNDGAMELDWDATLEAGRCYELRVNEAGDRVGFDLFELHPGSYAAMYPDD